MSQYPDQYNQPQQLPYGQQVPGYQAGFQQNYYPQGSYNLAPSSADDKNMAILAHLASAILSLLSFSTVSVIAPLVMWVVPLVVTILMVVFHSLAAIAAAHCNLYEYPMTFIKVIR